ncbi:MAG: hypothetical protein EOO93_03270 [Pedobacter sp.]|nr:MAG: hypothetical protein EOO93_03270 [Pedobacter sp.]
MSEISILGEHNYFMFCDQDDVWHSNKILLSLESILEHEKQQGSDHPILVHTDFQYVDSELNVLDVKVNVAKRLSQIDDKLKIIANDNYIFGCTMIINKPLLELSLPIPREAENHDYWIALHAAAFGKIGYLHMKTMLYRQHGNNVTGGLAYSTMLARIKRLVNFSIYITHKNRRLIQFNAFLQKERTKFSSDVYDILKQYMQNSLRGGLSAVFFMYRSGFRMRGISQTIVYYISIVLDKEVDLSNSGPQGK